MLQVFDLSLQFAHLAPMLAALPFERLPRVELRPFQTESAIYARAMTSENKSVLFREQSPNVVGD